MKYIVLGLVLCLSIGQTFSQRKSPSERRKERLEKESQNKTSPSERRKNRKSKENKVKVFGEGDPKFDITEVPDKWKNESAVVIHQKMDYDFLRDNDYVKRLEVVRKRIKLLDNSAVEEFSEFYFYAKENIGIKIIKSNGTEVDVSLDEAVAVKSSVPLFYRSLYFESIRYYKIAIANLEVGDIIDYFYKSEISNYSGTLQRYTFSPFQFTLSTTYPVMNQRIKFKVDRGFFINFNSYNGAPKLVKGEAGTDARGRKRANIKTYILEDSDREKLSSDIFNYKFLTSPTVKFQVHYLSKSGARNARLFIAETGEVKNTVTAKEVQKIIGNHIFDEGYYGGQHAAAIQKYLRTHHKGLKDPKKIAKICYYFLRYKVFSAYFPRNADGTHNYSKATSASIKNYRFVSIMMQVFQRLKLKFEVLAIIPRSVGTIDNLLFADELELGILVGGNKGLYMFPFSNYSNFDAFPNYLQGSEGYAFVPMKNKKINTHRKVTLPILDADENAIVDKLEVIINEGFETLTINKTTEITGQFKNAYSKVALLDLDYVTIDEKIYDDRYREQKMRGNKKRIAEEKRKLEEKRKERHEMMKKTFKDVADDDFSLVKYNDVELVADGRYDDSPILIYKESYEVEDLVNKAGRNYIFEMGKLIGSQLELKEKDMQRDNDIYISKKQKLGHELTIKIPDGYTVSGLDAFTFNVDNSAGSFISSAKMNGNILTISATKKYKSLFLKKDKWKEMTSFLEAAYEFTQKKVIIKKKR